MCLDHGFVRATEVVAVVMNQDVWHQHHRSIHTPLMMMNCNQFSFNTHTPLLSFCCFQRDFKPKEKKKDNTNRVSNHANNLSMDIDDRASLVDLCCDFDR